MTKPHFCDFHTHLHQYDINDKRLEEIVDNNILTVAASMDIPSYLKTKEIKKKLNTPLIIETFGIHPSCVEKPFNKDEALKYMDDSLLIGEIGLDYLWAKTDKEKQKEVFRFFLDYCNKKGKACVIHTKDAEKDVLEILNEFDSIKAIIHWYDGPIDIYKEMIKKGYYFTFGCEVKYSSHIRALLSLTPLDKLLLETDNPESEVWLGGTKRNPLLIRDIEEDVSKVLNIEKEEVSKITIRNALNIIQGTN